MKRTKWMLRTVLGSVLWAGAASCCAAQTDLSAPAPEPTTNCKGMPYLHSTQTDVRPIDVSELRGTVLDRNGVAMTNVCVGVFSQTNHLLLRYARSDTNGQFSIPLKGLPDGSYRLVAAFIEFCPVNAVLNFHSHAKAKKALLLHMQMQGATGPTGAPEMCSTVEARER